MDGIGGVRPRQLHHDHCVAGRGAAVASIRPSEVNTATRDQSLGLRHTIELDSKEYQVTLVVFDGNAIAEQLIDHATFWIAETFSGVPSLAEVPAAREERCCSSLGTAAPIPPVVTLSAVNRPKCVVGGVGFLAGATQK